MRTFVHEHTKREFGKFRVMIREERVCGVRLKRGQRKHYRRMEFYLKKEGSLFMIITPKLTNRKW